jgi:hypothetical protein
MVVLFATTAEWLWQTRSPTPLGPLQKGLLEGSVEGFDKNK